MQYCPTRWLSLLEIIDTLLRMKLTVIVASDKYRDVQKMTDSDRSMVERLAETIRPLNGFIDIVRVFDVLQCIQLF